MYFVKTLVVLFATSVMTSAMPSAGLLSRQTQPPYCNNYIGDCYSNDCDPSFANPGDTIGVCQNQYQGCYCNKCGGGVGYTGSCDNNGCNGYQGVCTAGIYDGCACN